MEETVFEWPPVAKELEGEVCAELGLLDAEGARSHGDGDDLMVSAADAAVDFQYVSTAPPISRVTP